MLRGGLVITQAHGRRCAFEASKALAAGHGDVALTLLMEAVQSALMLVAEEEGVESALDLAQLELANLLGLLSVPPGVVFTN